jgi:hypothetical protein
MAIFAELKEALEEVRDYRARLRSDLHRQNGHRSSLICSSVNEKRYFPRSSRARLYARI